MTEADLKRAMQQGQKAPRDRHTGRSPFRDPTQESLGIDVGDSALSRASSGGADIVLRIGRSAYEQAIMRGILS